VGAALATIDDAIRLILDRGDVLGAEMAGRIDPHRGDSGGSKVAFREAESDATEHAYQQDDTDPRQVPRPPDLQPSNPEISNPLDLKRA
jgi:hypothetical protein